MERTNEQRAELAYRTLLVYAQYGSGDPSNLDENLIDLVADLYHLAEQYGIDTDYVSRVALSHFTAEAALEKKNV